MFYSSNFIPKREVDDPLEAAMALLSADVSDKDKMLEVIQKTAVVTEETCKWASPLAWAGALQATASVLRGLVKHNKDLSEISSIRSDLLLSYTKNNIHLQPMSN